MPSQEFLQNSSYKIVTGASSLLIASTKNVVHKLRFGAVYIFKTVPTLIVPLRPEKELIYIFFLNSSKKYIRKYVGGLSINFEQ